MKIYFRTADKSDIKITEMMEEKITAREYKSNMEFINRF